MSEITEITAWLRSEAEYDAEGELLYGEREIKAATLIEEQASQIEELEQKLRTTSLEALAISDTNNEMAIRVAQLEKERDHWQSLHDARTKMLGDCADERDASQARSQAYEEQSKITNEMIIAVVHRAEDFGIALKDWQANALVCAAHEGRKK